MKTLNINKIYSKIVNCTMLSLFVSSCAVGMSYSADMLPHIRDLNTDPISIQDIYKPVNINTQAITSKSSTRLRGGVTDINCVIDKAQLLKFDEPVTRVSVANPDVADVIVISPREVQVNAKKLGTTSLIVWGRNGDPIFFDIIVGNNIDGFINAVNTAIPGNNLKFKFSNDSVVLSGNSTSSIVKTNLSNIAKAYGLKFVDVTESITPQVLLEIKVVEATKSYTKTIQNVFGIANNSVANATSSRSYRSLAFDKSSGIQFFEAGHNGTLSLADAETKGLAKTLAEPKLVTTNQNQATFTAGQEVPIPTGYDSQTKEITFSYKEIGVKMGFTPTIYAKSKRISLHVTPEVSEIDPTITLDDNGLTIYGFKTRKTDTTVELQSGDTLVIAGLLQKNDKNTKVQIPMLGNIPIIGDIFKGLDIKNADSELIIFVTPKLIDSNGVTDGV